MVFGGVERERIQLNEETLWDGGPRDTNNPKALEALPKVQQLLFEDKNEEATQLAGETMLGVPERIKSYQSLGDLFLEFSTRGCNPLSPRTRFKTPASQKQHIAAAMSFSTREAFATAVDNLIVIRIEADATEHIAFDITMTREQDASVEAIAANILRLDGQCGDDGVRFSAYLQVHTEGGKVESTGDSLSVNGADAVTLFLSAATSYVHQTDTSGNPHALCENYLTNIDTRPYADIRDDHIAEHQYFFQRVDLDLGSTEAVNLPTDERLTAVKAGTSDPGLIVLYFQYGRYLLMGSSRPRVPPPPICKASGTSHMNAPWNSDFHTNINLQMNYWVPEICNLPECHIPLFDYMDTLVEPGNRTAKIHYGADGWVVHHLSDIWGFNNAC